MTPFTATEVTSGSAWCRHDPAIPPGRPDRAVGFIYSIPLQIRRIRRPDRVFEPHALYKHVDGKDGLLDGIRTLLWEELRRALERGSNWRDSLRSTARCLRSLANTHPHAFPLILSGNSLDESMLQTLASGLATLEEAGFDRDRSAPTLNAVIHYALGYTMMEHACRTALGTPTDGEAELEAIVRLTRTLTANAPASLVRVTRDCCACDYDAQFEFGLQALLAGLDPRCDTLPPR